MIARLAAGLAAAPMNRVRPDGAGFHKQRTGWGQLAAAASLRLPLPVVMLSGDAWFAREDALYRALHGLSVARRGFDALWLPALPGERLDRCVAGLPWSSAHPAVVAAFTSLAALHRLADPLHPRRSCSHSDATARNAILDRSSRSVAFFDFETEHPLHLPDDDRRASDLLALGGSLAAVLAPDALAPLTRLVLAESGGSLRAAIARQASAPDAVLRAQWAMSARQRAGWVGAVLAAG